MNKGICECPICHKQPRGEWGTWKNQKGIIEYSFIMKCKSCTEFSHILPADNVETALSRWNVQVLHKILSKYGGESKIKEFTCPICNYEIDYKWIDEPLENCFGSAIILYCTNPECNLMRPFHLQEFSELVKEWNQYCDWVNDGIVRGKLNYSKRSEK